MSFFFFKQKTAYEMRISDWSSDVCSSDLQPFMPSAARSAVYRGTRASREIGLGDLTMACRPLDTIATRSLGANGTGGDLSHIRSRPEEHTSELKSLMRISYAVFCLHKKKKKCDTCHIYVTTI